MSSPELRALEGGYFNLIFMVSLIMFFCMFISLVQLKMNLFVNDTEDPSYVVTMCRVQIFMVFIVLICIACLWCWLIFPEDLLFSVGFETFAPYYRTGLSWKDMAECCANGAATGFLVSLLGDFYSSPNFVPALAIINST